MGEGPDGEEAEGRAHAGLGDHEEGSNEGASPGWAGFHRRSYEAGKAVRTTAIAGAERLSEASALATSGATNVARSFVETARKTGAELNLRAHEQRDPLLEAGRAVAEKTREQMKQLKEQTASAAGRHVSEAFDEVSERGRGLYHDRAEIAHEAKVAAEETLKKGKDAASILGGSAAHLGRFGARVARTAAKSAVKNALAAGREAQGAGRALTENAEPLLREGAKLGRDGAARAKEIGRQASLDAQEAGRFVQEKGGALGRDLAHDAVQYGAEAHQRLKDAVESDAFREATQTAEERTRAWAAQVSDGLSAGARIVKEKAIVEAEEVSAWARTDGLERSKALAADAHRAANEIGLRASDWASDAERIAKDGTSSAASWSADAAQNLSVHAAASLSVASELARQSQDAAKIVGAESAAFAKKVGEASKPAQAELRQAAHDLADKSKDLAEGLAGGAKAFWRGVKGEDELDSDSDSDSDSDEQE
ncbi:MAG: hypothetical protein IPK13_16265 [Deltaproteobacteria bacterium]|nr:hypothetical protein [Deltaproteobacteria bacterium]